VPERRVAQVVGQGNGLGQIFIDPQPTGDGPADLRDLQGVRQAGSVVVVDLADEDLGLAHQPAEGGGVNDALPVPLEPGPERVRVLGESAAAAVPVAHGVRGQPGVLRGIPIHQRGHWSDRALDRTS
jgi:hypothetical protein